MAMHALQFEFLPRKRRRWLRVLLTGLCLALMGTGAAVWWWRQAEVLRLQETARVLQAKAAASAAAASTPSAPPSWMAAARQDGRDLTPTADMRLLEIERCVADHASAIRITLDASGIAALEVQLGELGDSVVLLECLNEGIERGRWRLAALSAGSDASVTPSAKATLRFDPSTN